MSKHEADDLRTSFRAALVQMCSSRDVRQNLLDASDLIRDAASQGAQYVQTPEMTSLLESESARLHVKCRPEEGNPELGHFRALARELKIWLHLGSIAVLEENERIANRSFLISPDGVIAARYDKIHMFDVDLPNGESYRESRRYRPGAKAVLVDLPWGSLGLSICYDLRFPNLYRTLAKAGASFFAVPAAFTRTTGKQHWHCLLKARAIETGCFVLAAAQGGHHEMGRDTYGHSLIIAPWGETLAEAGVAPGIILATIDCSKVASARARIGSLHGDRPFELVHEPLPARPAVKGGPLR